MIAFLVRVIVIAVVVPLVCTFLGRRHRPSQIDEKYN